MERETGIEPATNSLEGCDSTTELLPPLPPQRLKPLKPDSHGTAKAVPFQIFHNFQISGADDQD
jgi:hypothetical protein